MRQITNNINHWDGGYRINQLSWSSDGKMIAFGSEDGVYVVDLTGKIITTFAKEGGYANYYVDWH